MAAESLLQHIVALKAFLNATPQHTEGELLKHKVDLKKKIDELPPITLLEATQVANQLQNFLPPENEGMLVALKNKVSTAAMEGEAVTKNQHKPLQNWVTFPNFLLAVHWEQILDDAIPRHGQWGHQCR